MVDVCPALFSCCLRCCPTPLSPHPKKFFKERMNSLEWGFLLDPREVVSRKQSRGEFEEGIRLWLDTEALVAIPGLSTRGHYWVSINAMGLPALLM